MSKTSFEIRLELLRLSQDHLTQTYYANIEDSRRRDEQCGSHTAITEKFPTFEDIVTKAEQLNKFVSNSDGSSIKTNYVDRPTNRLTED